VKATYWNQPINEDSISTAMTIANDLKRKKNVIKIKARSIIKDGVCNDVSSLTVQKQTIGDNIKVKSIKPRIVREHINVCKSEMRNDPRPIDENCNCYTCKNFSRAYLHHLFKVMIIYFFLYFIIF
jgi:hypothetical protein